MFSIKNELKTGQEFLNYLNNIFSKKQMHPGALDLALEAWNQWEKEGTSQPDNVHEIATDPMQTYRVYYLDILSVCDIENIESKSVFFLLLPIKNFNAYASTTANKDKVIVFDEELIPFFTAFIIAVMVAVYTDVPDSEVEFFDDFIISLLDDFFNRTKSRTTESNERYTSAFLNIIKKDYEFTEVGSYFSMAFTVFIICHEISHHMLGHTEEKRMYAISNNQGIEREIPLNTPSYEEEFEADVRGYKLYLELISKNEQAKTAKLAEAFNRAPLVFFEILDIAQIYAEKKIGYSFESDSHPSPSERKRRLLDQFESGLHEYGLEFYEGFMGYSNHIRKKIIEIDGV